ncbi:MAG: nucleoside recognition domain-containing protein [Ignavibacteriales bacterium]
MLNYIWAGMLVIGIVTGFLTGRVDEVTKALLDSSKGAVDLAIALLGALCLWTGIMEIASRAGIISSISNWVRPVTKFLFPGVPKDHPAQACMIMNMSANFLGLGNAATPLGLKAMNELQRLNRGKSTATDDMCMFLVINTCSIQLIPATLIALRSAAGSANPSAIICAVWITSLFSTAVGVTAAKIFARIWKEK